MVCLLDKGVIAAARIRTLEASTVELGPISTAPGFEQSARADGALKWSLLPVGSEETRLGANYGLLYFVLMSHLNSCVLMRPDLQKYMGRLLVVKNGAAFADVTWAK